MSTTIQSGTKYLNHSLLGPNNDEKWYYYSELTVLGKHPNRTFSLDLYASDSQDLSVATLIGTKDIKTGVLTLIIVLQIYNKEIKEVFNKQLKIL